jgi:hypothetical protein
VEARRNQRRATSFHARHKNVVTCGDEAMRLGRRHTPKIRLF